MKEYQVLFFQLEHGLTRFEEHGPLINSFERRDHTLISKQKSTKYHI
jgi:hypothetical protein